MDKVSPREPERADALDVPARTIPAPRSISLASQAALVRPPRGIALPSVEDVEAWPTFIAMMNQGLLQSIGDRARRVAATTETVEVDGVQVCVVNPDRVSPRAAGRVYLDIHGGGLFMGGGECCEAMALLNADRIAALTWSVDYRMPPEHPYPAALDDCVTAYRALLRTHRPQDIIVGGTSGGGNLAAALVLRARDEGLLLPAAVVLLTPEVDLTESGDSFQTILGIDSVLTQTLISASQLYAAGHDLAHPYLSPLFGDFTKGFPPTFLQSGTRDLFLSNTVRMHRALRAADVPAELHVFEAMPHGGFGGTREDAELDAELRRFVDSHWQ